MIANQGSDNCNTLLAMAQCKPANGLVLIQKLKSNSMHPCSIKRVG